MSNGDSDSELFYRPKRRNSEGVVSTKRFSPDRSRSRYAIDDAIPLNIKPVNVVVEENWRNASPPRFRGIDKTKISHHSTRTKELNLDSDDDWRVTAKRLKDEENIRHLKSRSLGKINDDNKPRDPRSVKPRDSSTSRRRQVKTPDVTSDSSDEDWLAAARKLKRAEKIERKQKNDLKRKSHRREKRYPAKSPALIKEVDLVSSDEDGGAKAKKLRKSDKHQREPDHDSRSKSFHRERRPISRTKSPPPVRKADSVSTEEYDPRVGARTVTYREPYRSVYVYNSDSDVWNDKEDEDENEAKTKTLDFPCPLCSETFRKGRKLKRHLEKVHDVINVEDCGLNPETMLMPAKIVSRVKKEKTEQRPSTSTVVSCKFPKCRQNCCSFEELKFHYMHEHDLSPWFECFAPFCMKQFPSIRLLEFHFEQFHPNAEDYLIDAKVGPPTELQFVPSQHVNFHKYRNFPRRDNGTRFPCHGCANSYPTYYSMRNHRQLVHSHEPPFYCFSDKRCIAYFYTKQELGSHLLTEHPFAYPHPLPVDSESATKAGSSAESENWDLEPEGGGVENQQLSEENWDEPFDQQQEATKKKLRKKQVDETDDEENWDGPPPPVPSSSLPPPPNNRNYDDISGAPSLYIIECNFPKCKQTFLTEDARKRHFVCCHGDVPTFSCSICQKIFLTQKAVDQHSFMAHSTVPTHTNNQGSRVQDKDKNSEDDLAESDDDLDDDDDDLDWTASSHLECEFKGCLHISENVKERKAHRRLHVGDVPKWKCKVQSCQVSFISKLILKKHVSIIHRQDVRINGNVNSITSTPIPNTIPGSKSANSQTIPVPIVSPASPVSLKSWVSLDSPMRLVSPIKTGPFKSTNRARGLVSPDPVELGDLMSSIPATVPAQVQPKEIFPIQENVGDPHLAKTIAAASKEEKKWSSDEEEGEVRDDDDEVEIEEATINTEESSKVDAPKDPEEENSGSSSSLPLPTEESNEMDAEKYPEEANSGSSSLLPIPTEESNEVDATKDPEEENSGSSSLFVGPTEESEMTEEQNLEN